MTEDHNGGDSAGGGEEGFAGGLYLYATVLRLTENDPRNDHMDQGSIWIKEGKHPDGDSYSVIDEEQGGFRDIECETLGVVGPAPKRMAKSDITGWAVETGEPAEIANGAKGAGHDD